MRRKKILVAVLALALVLGGGIAYDRGSDLQGKFSGKVKTTTSFGSATPVTASLLLTLANKNGRADNQEISVSEIDYETVYDPADTATVDPKAFSFASVSMKFADGVTPCSGTYWRYTLTDGNSAEDYLEYIFDKTTLSFWSTSDKWWSKDVDSSSTSLTNFKLADVSTLTGSDYYYNFEGTVKEGVDSDAYDEDLSLYLNIACVTKDGTNYLWDAKDAYGQNSYFNFASDGRYGLKIGTLKVTE